MTYAYLPGPNQFDAEISSSKGQHVAGNAVGILVLPVWYPLFPGNVANANTYNFPVLYKVLERASVERTLGADPALLDEVIEGGRALEQQGVRAIVAACGYFGNYQQEAAAALNVPTFLSSLLQIPLISRALKPG